MASTLETMQGSTGIMMSHINQNQFITSSHNQLPHSRSIRLLLHNNEAPFWSGYQTYMRRGRSERAGDLKAGNIIYIQKKPSAKINISYSILFNLTTSYSSYYRGKKGINRNKTSFFLLMASIRGCVYTNIKHQWSDHIIKMSISTSIANLYYRSY